MTENEKLIEEARRFAAGGRAWVEVVPDLLTGLADALEAFGNVDPISAADLEPTVAVLDAAMRAAKEYAEADPYAANDRELVRVALRAGFATARGPHAAPMTAGNVQAIRDAVSAAMSTLTIDELRELVMEPYGQFGPHDGNPSA